MSLLTHQVYGLALGNMCTPRQRNQTLRWIFERLVNKFMSPYGDTTPGSSSSNSSATNTSQTTTSQQNSQGGSAYLSGPPTAQTNIRLNNQPGFMVNIPPGTSSDLFVLFGVHRSRRTLEFAQVPVTTNEDKPFFLELRARYRELRGFWRYWLSVWQLKYCDFVKVSVLLFAAQQIQRVNCY